MPVFSEVIKILRKSKHLTQHELANKLNVTQQTVHCWEKGTREPNLNMLQKISEYFQVSLDYLLTGKDPNQRDSGKNFSSIPGTFVVDITKENMKKYPEYFDVAYQKLKEMALNSFSGNIIGIETGEEIDIEELKHLIDTLTDDEKLQFMQATVNEIEINTILKTIHISL